MASPTTGTVIREYRLTYADGGGRTNGDGDGLPSRELASVTPYGGGGYGVGAALPATTFEHTPLANGKRIIDDDPPWERCDSYQYPRLTRVDIGYGALISL